MNRYPYHDLEPTEVKIIPTLCGHGALFKRIAESGATRKVLVCPVCNHKITVYDEEVPFRACLIGVINQAVAIFRWNKSKGRGPR